MNINPKTVSGNWAHGWALDFHTIKSEHLGMDQFGHDVSFKVPSSGFI